MPDETSQPEKKIIVDEDWKSRVEAERQAEAARGQAAKPQEPPGPPQPADETPLPPPTLSYLAGTLYLQGAIALGLLPNPVSGKSEPQLRHAQHIIDTLGVLQEKTEGNRTPAETEEIEAMLYQLRMAFVELREHGPPPASPLPPGEG
ncbi:MAG: DUF1844 domain-containing protein [Thermoguttaceae bacterium]|jgi:hypothetical protein